MKIIQTLDQLPHPLRLAIVGAGGKTTALFQIASQLDHPAILTTSTHLGVDEARKADVHFVITSSQEIEAMEIPGGVQIILVTGLPTPDQRLNGLSPDLLEQLKIRADEWNLPLLVEADGSKKRSIKAPASHEPAIPGWVSGVMVVAGLSALGKPLGPEVVHRPDIFGDLCGLEPGGEITPDHLIYVLSSPLGGLKHIPANAIRIALLNQADTDLLKASAQKIALGLVNIFNSVIIAGLESTREHGVSACFRPIAGVILAAGGSTRLGQPKALLTWRGQTFIETVADTALKSGLSTIIVVTGEYDQEIRHALGNRPVFFVRNEDWKSGQASSIKAALRALPSHTGGVIFMLVDQPQVPVRYIQALLEVHHQTLAPIIIPLVKGQRGTPVLFDGATFTELGKIEGDSGGKQVFSKFTAHWLPWYDESMLLDVDSPEDYQRLQELS
jgi:molybdenum cofactor cytidylyltransferase